MRTIERTTTFKKDFKRESKGPLRLVLQDVLPSVVTALAQDLLLPPACRDHPLAGDWKDHRECHVRPDLLLIYAKPDANTLRLVRLGSHSELFG